MSSPVEPATPENPLPENPLVVSAVIAWGRTGAVDGSDVGKSPADPHDEPSTALQGRVVILATLFFVTGALGLPLLWRSDRIGPVERWFWALLVTLYTVGLIAGALLVVRWSVGESYGDGAFAAPS